MCTRKTELCNIKIFTATIYIAMIANKDKPIQRIVLNKDLMSLLCSVHYKSNNSVIHEYKFKIET